MRKAFAALLLLCLTGPMPWTAHERVAERGGQAIFARAVALPIGPRGSALHPLEAWALTSPNSRFGGFSGLALTGERRFLAVSDQGMEARFALPARGGAAVGTRIGPLTGMQPQARKALSDAEAVVYDAVTGTYWTSFEGISQIWRTDDRRGAVTARRRVAAMARWSANRGAEAMARLADGRFIILSEGADADTRGTEALLFPADPALAGSTPARFFYDDQGKGQVTDAATLPDGRLLLLHRRVDWIGFARGRQAFVSTIALADPADLRRDSVLRAVTIAVIGPDGLSDNFEGMVVGREQGETIMWLISDDNFNSWQGNVLLKYRVDLARLPQAAYAP
ncbi:MAG: hypothetical protein RLZZ58_2069 [Pseudomonadota bacterium]